MPRTLISVAPAATAYTPGDVIGQPTAMQTNAATGGRPAVARAGTAPEARRRTERVAKAALDRVLAALLLVLALPVLAIGAGLILVTDRGPVLYRQTRVGRHGRTFRMWKLRTMRGQGAVADGKAPRDPRVTGIGRLLRRSSVDELPQLVNVLAGSMSLVGPRPRLPEEMALPGAAADALAVRPGMTGLWQVSGRAELPWEERVRLDRLYLERWSLALDAWILARTAGAVLGGRGAY